jgi:hypothetical protein
MVLDDKAKKWVLAIQCPDCTSDLAAQVGDVNHRTLYYFDECSTHYWVECGACKFHIDVAKLIPDWVKRNAKKVEK